MEAGDIINAAAAYKQSSCVMAAAQIGLKDIFKNPRTLSEASGILGMKKELLKLFLLYCEAAGLLVRRDGAWVMEQEVCAAMEEAEPFIRYERLSMGKWNTPEAICTALKGNRRKLSPTDHKVYRKAMNGMEMKLVGLYIRRRFGTGRLSKILEIGSSGGTLGKIVAKNEEQVLIRAVQIGAAGRSSFELRNIMTEEGSAAVYSIVLLYNAVHYFTEQELERNFRWICRHTSSDSLIAVADIFLKPDSYQNHVYLPDWITHGGTGCLFEEDVRITAEKCGFGIVENRYIAKIHMNILFLKKRRENEQTDSRRNCGDGLDRSNGVPAVDSKDGPRGSNGAL